MILHKLSAIQALVCCLSVIVLMFVIIKFCNTPTSNVNVVNVNPITVKSIGYRLPTDVWPINYNILIKPHFEDDSDKIFTFDGTVEIKVKVLKPVSSIILHSEELTFSQENCTLKTLSGDMIIDFSVTFEADKNFVHFSKLHNSKFLDGLYVLKIKYIGTISTLKFIGMYSDAYANENGEPVPFVATNFMPVYARRVLPCFDEPNYKATMDVTIIHNEKYTALSNMPIENVSYINSTATTSFKTTPPISTYLLAFIVSDFKNIANEAKNTTLYTTSKFVSDAVFSFELSQRILRELEIFTNINYEIGKLDHIGLPSIMNQSNDNAGLIIYGRNMLFEFKFTNLEKKISPAFYVASGVIHQWFGTLATPKWWKYAWLSESISTYMTFYILNKVEPTLEIMKYFDITVLKESFDVNSNTNSSAIVYDVNNPSEIESILDPDLLHRKGSCIVRMLQHVLTESTFQKALQNYLRKRYHANADSENFYEDAQEVIDKENIKLQIKPFMDSWLNFGGYPLVTIIRNYETNKIEIQQERFVLNDQNNKNKINNHMWHIPINYASKKKLDFENTTPEYWLMEESITLDIKVKPEEWIIVNKQMTGFYRVNYDKQNWKLIIDYLKSPDRENIHEINRAQLMFDALEFVQQGILDIEILLQLHDYLKNETSCLVWMPGLIVLRWLKAQLLYTENYSVFQKYASRVLNYFVEIIDAQKYKTHDDFTNMCYIQTKVFASLFDKLFANQINWKERPQWLKKNEKKVIDTILKLNNQHKQYNTRYEGLSFSW